MVAEILRATLIKVLTAAEIETELDLAGAAILWHHDCIVQNGRIQGRRS